MPVRCTSCLTLSLANLSGPSTLNSCMLYEGDNPRQVHSVIGIHFQQLVPFSSRSYRPSAWFRHMSCLGHRVRAALHNARVGVRQHHQHKPTNGSCGDISRNVRGIVVSRLPPIIQPEEYIEWRHLARRIGAKTGKIVRACCIISAAPTPAIKRLVQKWLLSVWGRLGSLRSCCVYCLILVWDLAFNKVMHSGMQSSSAQTASIQFVPISRWSDRVTILLQCSFTLLPII